MAIFLAELKTFSRTRGESSTAAAAYRAGIDLADDRLGVTHRFSRRTGVEDFQVLAPADAPEWARDIKGLWNAVEVAEVRRNARVARELIVGLPCELSATDRQALAVEVAQALIERYQVAVLVAVHAPDKRGDQRNHHAHLLFTTRAIGAKGLGAKVRCLDDRDQGPKEVLALRQIVERLANNRLAAAGFAERVDARTLAVQAKEAEAAGDFDKAARLTREPMRRLGRQATAAMRRGASMSVVSENADRLKEHQQDLATYLAKARAQGRVMPPAADGPKLRSRSRGPHSPAGRIQIAKSTGVGARVLNEQARALEESHQASKKVMREFLEGVLKDLRTAQDFVDAYLALSSRSHQRQLWQARCAADPALLGMIRESVESRVRLLQLRKKTIAHRAKVADIISKRRSAQQAAEDPAAQPAAWQMAARRKWKAKRAAQAARVRRAVLDEQRAKQSHLDGQSMVKQEQAVLRDSVRRIEQVIATRIAPSTTPVPGADWSGSTRMPERPTSPSQRFLH